MFQHFYDSRHLKGRPRVNFSWRRDVSFALAPFWNLKVPQQGFRGTHKPVLSFSFAHLRRWGEWEVEREKTEPWGRWRGQRAEETAGVPDQMGMWGGEACFAPVQRWGRAKRVVHQIFIWASVRSLEMHYGAKAAENILEEQLNKNVAYL